MKWPLAAPSAGREDFEALYRWDREEGSVGVLEFSPDKKKLLAGTARGMVGFWDAGTWQRLELTLRLEAEVTAAAFSPDGRRVAIGCSTGTIEVWDLAVTPPSCRPFSGGHSGLRSLAFSPDGTTLLSAGNFSRWARLGQPVGAASAVAGRCRTRAIADRNVDRRTSGARLKRLAPADRRGVAGRPATVARTPRRSLARRVSGRSAGPARGIGRKKCPTRSLPLSRSPSSREARLFRKSRASVAGQTAKNSCLRA